ncbi:hypothetical protein PENTCL1PPCAC_429, partial [Pristionchus entomophagus]
ESLLIDDSNIDVIVAETEELVVEINREATMRMMNVGGRRKMYRASIRDAECSVHPSSGIVEAGAIAMRTAQRRSRTARCEWSSVMYVFLRNVLGSRCSAFTVRLSEKSDRETAKSVVAVYPPRLRFRQEEKPGTAERKVVLVNFSGNRKAYMMYETRAVTLSKDNKSTSGIIPLESFTIMTVNNVRY